MARFSSVSGESATLPQDLGTTDSPTFVKIVTTSNGAIDNLKFGDDVFIGDGNIANHIVIKGNQTATNAGVVLGSGKTEKVSTNGTNLSLDASNDIIFNPGSTYVYVGTPVANGNNRLAKWSETLIYRANVPAHDHGAAGDRKGMFSYDSTHLFICTADYVNDSTVIWKRINWAGGNW